MQEPTCSAKVDDLPCSWPLREDGVATANTVRLSCAHTFHAAALALHFLATDMRCPVCRKGSIERMDIATVPLSVRHLYADKLRCLLLREVEVMDPVHIIEVLSNLELEMRMFSARDELGRPTHLSTARTRVMFDEPHVQDIQRSMLLPASEFSNTLMTNNFPVHRSFQRVIRCLVARQNAHNPQRQVQFALTHPLLPLTIASAELSVAVAWTNHLNPVGMPEQRASLPLFCAAVGGTQPVAFIHSAYCNSTQTTRITVDVNMHMIINISDYVGDVLASIRVRMIDTDIPAADIPGPASPTFAPPPIL